MGLDEFEGDGVLLLISSGKHFPYYAYYAEESTGVEKIWVPITNDVDEDIQMPYSSGSYYRVLDLQSGIAPAFLRFLQDKCFPTFQVGENELRERTSGADRVIDDIDKQIHNFAREVDKKIDDWVDDIEAKMKSSFRSYNYTHEREQELWIKGSWNLNLVVGWSRYWAFEIWLNNWIDDDEYIFLCGGNNIKRVLEFVLKTTAERSTWKGPDEFDTASVGHEQLPVALGEHSAIVIARQVPIPNRTSEDGAELVNCDHTDTNGMDDAITVVDQKRKRMDTGSPSLTVDMQDTPLHLFKYCSHTCRFWDNISDLPPVQPTDDFAAWLSKVVEGRNDEVIRACMALCWSIWKGRNDMLWNNKPWKPSEVGRRAAVMAEEWNALSTPPGNPFTTGSELADDPGIDDRVATTINYVLSDVKSCIMFGDEVIPLTKDNFYDSLSLLDFSTLRLD
nr:protein SIEVE ELEMENT OCCLUSION B-like [Ipomoea batatas]